MILPSVPTRQDEEKKDCRAAAVAPHTGEALGKQLHGLH